MNLNQKEINSKSMKNSIISACFSKIKKEERIALMPFIMAGDPDLDTSAQIILNLQDKGADIIELGIPYSDPLADGPTIQLAAARALSADTSPSDVLEMLSNIRGQLNIPIILFTYSNPLLNFGMEDFCDRAFKAGAAGLVVPDLPLEESEKLSSIASEKGLDLILLIAPTTPIERMKLIAQKSNGFIYLVSVTGVTGERTKLQNNLQLLITQIKKFTDKPVAVGFGISDTKHITQVRRWGADGAIVGSALVKTISMAPDGYAVEEAGKFCSQLRNAASSN